MSSHVAKQRDPIEVLVEIVMADNNNAEEEERERDEQEIPCEYSATKALRRSNGGSLHMRSYCVCGEDKLTARRQSRSSLKLQRGSATIVSDSESEK